MLCFLFKVLLFIPVFIHPDYQKDLPNNADIALLKLANPLSYSSTIRPVCFPSQISTIPEENAECYVTGMYPTVMKK